MPSDLSSILCRQYRKTAHYNVTHRRRQNFYALPTAQWQMLAAPPFSLLANLDKVDNAIEANGEIASAMLKSALESFGLENNEFEGAATSSDLDKARSTIRQLYRDWSTEGDAERQACYGPVLRDVELAFGSVPNKSAVRILVPGAGLGRLVFETCRLHCGRKRNFLSSTDSEQLGPKPYASGATIRSLPFRIGIFECDKERKSIEKGPGTRHTSS